MRSLTLIAFIASLANSALADGWRTSYEAGLKAAHSGQWAEARACFKKADSLRHKDSDRPTLTSDKPSIWRSGAPYSPNFLAAYAEYRLALDCKDGAEQAKDFFTAQTEFERLLAIGQKSRDAYFYLDLTYTHLNDQTHRARLAKGLGSHGQKFTWKVDEDCLAPEELSAMQLGLTSNGAGGSVAVPSNGFGETIKAGDLTTGAVGQALNPIVPGLALGNVPHIPDKFALVIGEDSSQLGSLSCASYDAKQIRDGLVDFAGYDAGNVVLVQNAATAAVMAQAKALATKVPQDGVVFVFYAGPASSIQGRDYLAGSDTASRFDTETMISKSALYDMFLQRGARIFSFYEVNRPIENGFFFGSEVPQVGSVSQMEATIPDAEVTSTVANGHPIGLYVNSFVEVLAELRSNRVPIYEFGWQLYNKMKRGNTGLTGGGGHQIPTLPVLNNLAADARF